MKYIHTDKATTILTTVFHTLLGMRNALRDASLSHEAPIKTPNSINSTEYRRFDTKEVMVAITVAVVVIVIKQ
jgi:hypothetical protein